MNRKEQREISNTVHILFFVMPFIWLAIGVGRLIKWLRGGDG